MRDEEKFIREYKINSVAQKILQDNLSPDETKRINSGVGWDIPGDLILPDRTVKHIVFSGSLSQNDIDEAIKRSEQLKKLLFCKLED
ncbi:MAG: hypothetical protein ACLQED_05570 [Desulfobaccales bacterium]